MHQFINRSDKEAIDLLLQAADGAMEDPPKEHQYNSEEQIIEEMLITSISQNLRRNMTVERLLKHFGIEKKDDDDKNYHHLFNQLTWMREDMGQDYPYFD